MPLQPNIVYLDKSQKNPEPALDECYYQMKQAQDLAQIVARRERINLCLRNLKQRKLNATYLYNQLARLLSKSEGNTEFECFLYACDCSKAVKRSILANPTYLRQAVSLYLKNRHIPYRCKLRSQRIQSQALLDRSVSISRQGGEPIRDKLRKLISDSLKTNPTLSALALHAAPKDNDLILSSRTHSDTCLIKVLHLKEQGGEQTNHINGLLTWLNTPNAKQTYSCAFVDGIYSNNIISVTSGDTRISDIQAALSANPSAFWLNTKGFEEFIKNFV